MNSLIGKQPECLRHSQAVIRGQLGKLPPDYGVKTHVEIIAHQLLFIITSYLFETVFFYFITATEEFQVYLTIHGMKR